MISCCHFALRFHIKRSFRTQQKNKAVNFLDVVFSINIAMLSFFIFKCNCFSTCREIQASSTEWLKGSCGAVDHLPTSDVLRKSIRRSWTISSEIFKIHLKFQNNNISFVLDPEDDPNNPNAQNPVADNLYPQQQNLIEAQSAGSFPTLDVRHHHHHQQSLHRNHPIINYNTGSAITISAIGINSSSSSGPSPAYHVNPQRRVLRQSTLPTTLPNNDPNLTGSGSNLENYNSVNLTAPTSPHQMQKGPLYPTAYNSEDIINIETTDCDNYVQQLQQQQQQQQQAQIPQQPGQPTPPTHHRLQVNTFIKVTWFN